MPHLTPYQVFNVNIKYLGFQKKTLHMFFYLKQRVFFGQKKLRLKSHGEYELISKMNLLLHKNM